MGEQETWTTQEFGSSHEGAVGVLLADGAVPGPVFFDTGSGAGGAPVSQWSVYDGHFAHVPRAAALRAVCSCGWSGTRQQLDWGEIGDRELPEAGAGAADACFRDWDTHRRGGAVSRSPAGGVHRATGPADGGDREAGEVLTAGGPEGRAPAGGDRRTDRVLAGPRCPAGDDCRAGCRCPRAGRRRGKEADGPLRPLESLHLSHRLRRSPARHVAGHGVATCDGSNCPLTLLDGSPADALVAGTGAAEVSSLRGCGMGGLEPGRAPAGTARCVRTPGERHPGERKSYAPGQPHGRPWGAGRCGGPCRSR